MNKIKLYSYVVTHDHGFAPNPYFGLCTVSCCKPVIRRWIGDHFSEFEEFWIVGLSTKEENNRIIYAMKVSDVMTFKEYFYLHPEKIPDFKKKEQMYLVGDNIYKPLRNGQYSQLRSIHSKNYHQENWQECIENMEHDLDGKYVLISNYFYYFGSTVVDLPDNLYDLRTGRPTKCKYDVDGLMEFLQNYKRGINGDPTHSIKNNKSCGKC